MRTPAMPTKLIAYYRVSTKAQGESGLGLGAQRHAVEAYARYIKGKVVATYKDVESGTKSARPGLAEAIEHAKKTGATLVVAKLDRLSRNVVFMATLMESKVDFVACDNPHANALTIHIVAAVAEDEARRIRERTRAALAEAKRRGIKLGWYAQKKNRGKKPKPKPKPSRRRITTRNRAASKRNQAAAVAFNGAILEVVTELRAKGRTLLQIAAKLNSLGHRTRTLSRKWSAANVSRLCCAGG